MQFRSIHEVLQAVREDKVSISQAERILRLNALSVVDDIARLDTHRFLRRGVPEIVYAKGKTLKQLQTIVKSLLRDSLENQFSSPVILSKVSDEQANFIRSKFSKKRGILKFRYFREANIVTFFSRNEAKRYQGRVALIAAGTSDIMVLNEAEIILEILRCRTIRFNDVGIAALKRLYKPLREIERFDPDCIIVAAGMEGALPSLIASLASVPVIGLPTSVGYGYGSGGEAALMSMLQACPLGICVVNIDGGVAAGIIASLIAKRSSRNN
jgi:NCAIR mutase (PurE)-related protein